MIVTCPDCGFVEELVIGGRGHRCPTHHACDCITERNRQLETALRELVEAGRGLADHVATLSAADVGSHVFDDIASDIKEIADHPAANNLLATPNGEDDAE